MRTLVKTAVGLGFIGATAIGTTAAVQAQGYGYYPQPHYHGYYYLRHYPRYYGYYGGGGGNGCRPGWTVQGGVCKPYRYGPWDIYGGRQSDYGM
jgi:hypothetical protein